MSLNLSLPDQLMLLSLDDDKGSFDASGIYLSYNLIGSAIAELVINGNIKLVDKTLVAASSEGITHPFLSKFYTDFTTKWDGKKSKAILQHFALHFTTFKELIINHLVGLDILKVEHKKILWVFKSKKFPQNNGLPESLLRSSLKRKLKGIEPLTEKDICLIKFLLTTGLIKQFKPQHKKLSLFKKETEQLLKAAAVPEHFKILQQEIDDSIITAIVVITTIT